MSITGRDKINHRIQSNGFTLMELLATIAIVGILAAVGLPSMSSMINRAESAGYANNFHHALSLARSEAIKRGVQVQLCTSNRAQSACSNSAGWEQGWIVKELVDVDGRESLIFVQEPLEPHFTFHGNSAQNNSSVVFTVSGTTNSSGEFVLCKGTSVDQNTRTVLLSRFGKVSVRTLDGYTPTQCYNGA